VNPQVAISHQLAILVIQIPTHGEEIERKVRINSYFEVKCLGTDICRSDGRLALPYIRDSTSQQLMPDSTRSNERKQPAIRI
jgi:hypothetical protein